MNKQIFLNIVVIFFQLPLSAQLTIGIKSGITRSVLTELDNRKLIVQNSTYEICNLNTINYRLSVGYTFKNRLILGFGYGSITTGFSESAVFNTLNNLSGSSAKPVIDNKYLLDNTFDFKFEYINFNFDIGYKVRDNLEFKMGICRLVRQATDKTTGDYFTVSRYQSIINLYQLTKEKEIDIRQSDEDAFYEYKNDIALKIGIEYFILKGFHFELSYLRGFNRPLEFPFDNKMYNQAFLFNVGYQWKLFAQNRVK